MRNIFWFVLLLLGGLGSAWGSRHAVQVRGESLLLNGVGFKVIGLRCSNALISDRAARELADNLPVFKGYGVNTVSVFLMGSRFGDVAGIRPDATLDPAHAARLSLILAEADRQGMVVLVGALYFGTSKASAGLDWRGPDAARAVGNAAAWLQAHDHRNVILDPDNEGMSGWPIGPMIDSARKACPACVIGYNSKAVPPGNADVHMHFAAPATGKPWLESEGTPGDYWGEYSRLDGYYNYVRIGRYSPALKSQAIARAKRDIAQWNGHMLASTWLQAGPLEGIGGPFMRPGGLSLIADVDADIRTRHPDAGIRWWLEAMRSEYGAWSPPVPARARVPGAGAGHRPAPAAGERSRSGIRFVPGGAPGAVDARGARLNPRPRED